MTSIIRHTYTNEVFEKDFTSLLQNTNIKSILIIIHAEESIDKDFISILLKSSNKNVFGGLFPGFISGYKHITKGYLLHGFGFSTKTGILPNISECNEKRLQSHLNEINLEAKKSHSIMVLVDGLTSNITCLMEALFMHYGLEINYFGGGAGSLSLEKRECIITNNGFHKDTAILVLIKKHIGIGVFHGWESISEDLRITKSDRNIVMEIDYQPAYKVYKKIVEHHSGLKFSEHNFFEISKAYPFGLSKLDSECIVRDPIAQNLGNITCVGEVQQGAFANILFGEKEKLIRGAKIATQRAMDNLNISVDFAFITNCISRVLFHDKEFPKELQAIKETINNDTVHSIGILSLGEIANNGQEYLEFYNKTTVISLLNNE